MVAIDPGLPWDCIDICSQIIYSTRNRKVLKIDRFNLNECKCFFMNNPWHTVCPIHFIDSFEEYLTIYVEKVQFMKKVEDPSFRGGKIGPRILIFYG
jgi:hypothetical protein